MASKDFIEVSIELLWRHFGGYEKFRNLFFAYASEGNIAGLDISMTGKIPVDASDENYMTSLLHAAKNDRIGAVEKLLAAQASVNSFDKFEMTALMYAAKNGNLEMVQILIKAGADINQEVNHTGSALAYAVHHNHPQVVQYLIDGGAKFDSAAHIDTDKGRICNTMMGFAMDGDNTEIVEILIKAGAKVGRGYISDARRKNNQRMVDLLLAAHETGTRTDEPVRVSVDTLSTVVGSDYPTKLGIKTPQL